MADKMMRMAGRGNDGTAKALKSDNDGNLVINVMNNELKELRRTLDKLALGVNDVYKTGTEFIPLKTVARTGTSSYVKTDRYILLSLYDNPTNKASINMETVNTFTPTIDNVEHVEIEYAIENNSSFNAVVSTLVYAEENSEWSVGKQEIHTAGTVSDSEVVRLNVNTATLRNKKLFIRVGIADTSTSESVNFSVKIKRITLIGNANAGQTLTAKDMATKEITELTSIKDNSGNNVLRVVDSAPFGYDEYTGTIMQTNRKSVEVYNEAPTTVISAGTNERTRITPATNSIATLNQFGVHIPAISGSTGKHRIIITIRIPQGSSNPTRIYVMEKDSTASLSIDFLNNQEIRDIFRGLIFSDKEDLVVEYLNNSDTNHTGPRYYYATYLQELVSL